MSSGIKAKTPRLAPDEAKKVSDRIDRAIQNFTGTVDELEGAIGMYLVGRHVGWRVLLLMHSKTTIRKYEGILDIDIRKEFPEEGPDVDRSIGYRIAKTLSNFWKVVSGAEKIEGRRLLE